MVNSFKYNASFGLTSLAEQTEPKFNLKIFQNLLTCCIPSKLYCYEKGVLMRRSGIDKNFVSRRGKYHLIMHYAAPVASQSGVTVLLWGFGSPYALPACWKPWRRQAPYAS
jgi:hypothetical protein